MVQFLGLFVQHPLRILAIGALLALIWVGLRVGSMGKRADSLRWPVLFSVLFAAWEWYVLVRTPDANVRVDLLLIWPAFLAVILWSIWRVVRH